MKEMESAVRELLDEIGHRLALPAIRTVAFLIRGPIRQVIQAIHISQKGVEEVWLAVCVLLGLHILCCVYAFAF